LQVAAVGGCGPPRRASSRFRGLGGRCRSRVMAGECGVMAVTVEAAGEGALAGFPRMVGRGFGVVAVPVLGAAWQIAGAVGVRLRLVVVLRVWLRAARTN
jgi:hypothetical protein